MNGSLPVGDFLNVGSGPVVEPGWISVDGSWQAKLAAYPALARIAGLVTGREVGHWPRGIVCRDIRDGLGRPPGSAAVIYSSHFIEHLRRDEAVRFLCDCKATLTPGGVCRMVTPDLRALAGRYLAAEASTPSAAEDFLRDSLLVEANGSSTRGLLRWYRGRTQFDAHKWLYDGASLCRLFSEAGFAAPEVRVYLDSRIPAERLAQVERRERIDNGAGMVVEAVA